MLLGCRRNDIHFGPYRDTRVPSDHRAIGFLERFYRKEKPVLVLTHSTHDRHQDHVAVATASVSAFRRAPRLLSFKAPSATADFRPTCYIDITDELEVKARALACHVSQIRKCMSLEYNAMTSSAAYEGQQAGVLYAEAFEAQRFLVPQNLG
jgi:LmbE family N-acetylglucosaminyl deacetylase